jgi:hypothetical protein
MWLVIGSVVAGAVVVLAESVQQAVLSAKGE